MNVKHLSSLPLHRYSTNMIDHSYIITFFTTCFILPLGLIFFCYGKLLRKLRKVSMSFIYLMNAAQTLGNCVHRISPCILPCDCISTVYIQFKKYSMAWVDVFSPHVTKYNFFLVCVQLKQRRKYIFNFRPHSNRIRHCSDELFCHEALSIQMPNRFKPQNQ